MFVVFHDSQFSFYFKGVITFIKKNPPRERKIKEMFNYSLNAHSFVHIYQWRILK
jgi:hypothetical protein